MSAVDTNKASNLNSPPTVGWVQVMSTSGSFQNAGNSESESIMPVPWSEANLRASLCVIISLDVSKGSVWPCVSIKPLVNLKR